MLGELMLWLGWLTPSATCVALDRSQLAPLPPLACSITWALWLRPRPNGLVLVAAALGALALLAWHLRRRHRRCVTRTLERVEDAQRAWWRAMRALTTVRASFCARLIAYALAARECGHALRDAEQYGIDVPLLAPPQPPELRPEAPRPGPASLWEQFDSCQRAVNQRASLNPSGDCLVLSDIALELVHRIARNDPAVPAHAGGTAGNEHPGPTAAMMHALGAPTVAAATAAHLHEDPASGMTIDLDALAERVERSGTQAEQTLVTLACLLAGRPVEEVTVSQLLELEDTDLAHALEAVALKRGLRRVYPSQRPDSLWIRAALTEDER